MVIVVPLLMTIPAWPFNETTNRRFGESCRPAMLIPPEGQIAAIFSGIARNDPLGQLPLFQVQLSVIRGTDPQRAGPRPLNATSIKVQ